MSEVEKAVNLVGQMLVVLLLNINCMIFKASLCEIHFKLCLPALFRSSSEIATKLR